MTASLCACVGQPLNGYIIGALQEKRDRSHISLVQSAIAQRDAERLEKDRRQMDNTYQEDIISTVLLL